MLSNLLSKTAEIVRKYLKTQRNIFFKFDLCAQFNCWQSIQQHRFSLDILVEVHCNRSADLHRSY